MATDKPEAERIREGRTEKDELIERNMKVLNEMFEELLKERWLKKQSQRRAKGIPVTQDYQSYLYHMNNPFSDLSKCEFPFLEYVLENSDEPDHSKEEIEACEREINRRQEVYKAWKAKNAPEEEEDDDSDKRTTGQEQQPKEITIIHSTFTIWDEVIRYLETGNDMAKNAPEEEEDDDSDKTIFSDGNWDDVIIHLETGNDMESVC